MTTNKQPIPLGEDSDILNHQNLEKYFEARHGKKPKRRHDGRYESPVVNQNFNFFRCGVEYALVNAPAKPFGLSEDDAIKIMSKATEDLFFNEPKQAPIDYALGVAYRALLTAMQKGTNHG